MSSNIFIPSKVCVGYQKRTDTYTGKLAYVIPYDPLTGKLRKETSWKHWRDEKIPAEDYLNEPTEGFVLNKDIQRYRWDWYGSGRSYIRVFDPRGAEFEITPENLITILMHTDCNKRTLTGSFVYGWCGKELVLLPCDSDAYRDAVKHTELISVKFSLRDLTQGHTYVTKKAEEVIYLGRSNWTENKWQRGGNVIKTERKHIFCDLKGKRYFPLESREISTLVSDEIPQNFAELVEGMEYVPAIFNGNVEIKWEPCPPPDRRFKTGWGGHSANSFFVEKEDCLYSVYFEHHSAPGYYFQRLLNGCSIEELKQSDGYFEVKVRERLDKDKKYETQYGLQEYLIGYLGLPRFIYNYKDEAKYKAQLAQIPNTVKPYWELKGHRQYCKGGLYLRDPDKSWNSKEEIVEAKL